MEIDIASHVLKYSILAFLWCCIMVMYLFVFAYSESKLTCHFVLVVVVLVVVFAKRSEKVGKRSKKVAFSRSKVTKFYV